MNTKYANINDNNNLLYKLLNIRGLDTPEKIKKFLYPKLTYLHNPFLLNDLEKAILRVRHAINKKEKILVYGDKDVDGQTSTALLLKILSNYKLDCMYYIPNEEGYGLHDSITSYILENKINLVITVDCGITNVNEVNTIKNLGVDVIILDHHEALDELPKSCAVVNPKRKDSTYPFRDLAGCGVVFKFGMALHFSFTYYFNKNIVIFDYDDKTKNGLIAILKNGIIQDKFDLSSNKKIKEYFNKGELITVCGYKLKMDYIKEFFGKENSIQILDISDLIKDENLGEENSRKRIDRITESFWFFLSDVNIYNKFYCNKYLDLVSLATIADIMPLVDENRVMVKYGLEVLERTHWKGLEVLRNHVLDGSLKYAHDISWKMTPVLNSAGRMGNAEVGVNLLISEDVSDILKFHKNLLMLNENRKDFHRRGIAVIKSLIDENEIYENEIIFGSHKDVHKGVTGLIASSLVNEYKKTAIIFSVSDEKNEAVGSVRSLDGFDVMELLDKCKDLILHYGGHKNAAGLTIAKDNIDLLKKRMFELIKELQKGDQRNFKIDLIINLKDLTGEFFEKLHLFEPFGKGNEYPVFHIRDVKFNTVRWIGQDKNHFKGTVKLNSNNTISSSIEEYEVIGWSLSKEFFNILNTKDNFDIIAQVDKNFFNGIESWRLKILKIN
jgi:single-stranded-DNA-specific exonuclease